MRKRLMCALMSKRKRRCRGIGGVISSIAFCKCNFYIALFPPWEFTVEKLILF
jgi:hypothetical protein